MLKRLWRKWGPNPLDRKLKRAAKKNVQSVLMTWNRGMGDVPLGVYALVYRIRQFLPSAKITLLVRAGLKDAFTLLEGIEVFAAEHWKRGTPFILDETLEEVGLSRAHFDLILENPDPTQWVKWQLGTLVPKLSWDSSLDKLSYYFELKGKRYIALHVHTETTYGYEKNWPESYWRELCERLVKETGATLLLFGLKATSHFEMDRVIDLRGKTTLFEMIAIVKNCCTHLVAPDSGVLSLVYYINDSFPLRIVSLWADPRQGVLKQNVASPNPELVHVPLCGKDEKVANISVQQVIEALSLKVQDPLLNRQRQALLQKKEAAFDGVPLASWKTPSDRSSGMKLLNEGKVGCLILAGGQGSRLGMHLPKGLVPVSPIKSKTLFQLLCEKTKAASLQAGQSLPLAIMTSPLNHEQTVSYIEKNDRFGLGSNQISFFTQEMLPFLDDKGHWLLDSKGKITEGPDGNGSALSRFFHSGIWSDWQRLGIEYVNVVLIDNPLADPFDPALFAAHAEARADVTLKCVPRLYPEEKVGLVAERSGKIQVVEYFELPEEERLLPKWHVANVSLFCFSMEFIAKTSDVKLPWHLARKGGLWKFETFIFDLLSFSEKTEVVLYPREEAYSPLKNASGEASVETVRTALLASDRRIYQAVSGLIPPEKPFELDPAFYYPTSQLLESWKGKELPNSDYIESVLT